jgi:hypothetical protein
MGQSLNTSYTYSFDKMHSKGLSAYRDCEVNLVENSTSEKRIIKKSRCRIGIPFSKFKCTPIIPRDILNYINDNFDNFDNADNLSYYLILPDTITWKCKH